MFICQYGHVFIEEIDYLKKCVLFMVLSDGGVVSRSHNFFIVSRTAPALNLPREDCPGPGAQALNHFIHDQPLTEDQYCAKTCYSWLCKQKTYSIFSWSG